MSKVWNFYAGPATLPKQALETAREELIDFHETGMSIMETSHRSKTYDAVHTEAKQRLASLFGVGDDYQVLFLQGGASLQFAMVAMNFIPQGGSADYVVTGTWAKKALKEANIIASGRAAASSEADGFKHIPTSLDRDPNAAFLHITSNNTVAGTQYFDYPERGDGRLVADMSSDMLWRPTDGSQFDLIYGGAQKNLGPSGVVVVVVRKDWVEQANSGLPTMLDYRTHVSKDSLYNTPPSFSVYMLLQTLRWIEDVGGLEAIEKRNREKAGMLYGAMADSGGFYRCPVAEGCRSLMNVVFRLPSEDLEAKFIANALAKGMVGLKGHRSVGGCRASIYNAMESEGVAALASFMRSFQSDNS